MRNLVIDQGNSKIKYGIFADDVMEQMVSKEVFNCEEILNLATNQGVENIIYSSVAQTLSHNDKGRMEQEFYFLELTHQLKLPITNAYETPSTLGLDRLAAVVGAYSLFPKQNCLIVDAGTCMTLEILTDDGVYLGGNISPGVRMRLQSMHQFTARLPLVNIGQWNENWGISTETALQNGGLLGACLEIEGLEKRLRQKWPQLKCLITGGDAELLANQLECKIFVYTNLVLIGLNKILTYNVEQLA